MPRPASTPRRGKRQRLDAFGVESWACDVLVRMTRNHPSNQQRALAIDAVGTIARTMRRWRRATRRFDPPAKSSSSSGIVVGDVEDGMCVVLS